MSFLVFGGAFVVALLAIIGLVVILRQEQQAQVTPARPVVTEKIPPLATASAPTKAQESEAVRQTLPVKRDTQFSVDDHNNHLSISDGQFHELVVELHSLHKQSQELEHRLSILTEMVGRIQRSPNGRFDVEDETYHAQDISSTSTK